MADFSSDAVTLNPNWQWQEWEGLPYLTCKLLEAWPHGFFTCQFFPKSPQDLTDILQPNTKAYRLKQVHGNQVLFPKEIEAEMTEEEGNIVFPPGDAAIAIQEKQSVWVASADCTPILIGDVVTGQCAAVHAGWRGTAQGIVGQVVSRLLSQGSVLPNLRFALGPAIAGEVYQVTEEVAAEVGVTVTQPEYLGTSQAVLAAVEAMPDSPILPDDEPGRVRLDVRQVNVLQLKRLGINLEQIAIAPCCTYQQPDYFFSYRRTQEKKVQWSGIVFNQ